MNIYVAQTLILLLFSACELFTNISDETRRVIFYISALWMMCFLFFRLYTVGSDLGRYHTHFITYGNMAITDILRESGRDNIGFYLYNSIIYSITKGNYQAFISITSLITFLPVVRMIRKTIGYSITALYVYMSMGFYSFQFSGLKQAIAMGMLALAMIDLIENNRRSFYVWALVAVLFHYPALVFLPAYELTHQRISNGYKVISCILVVIIFVFRDQIVTFLGEGYETTIETSRVGVGGKVLLMIAMLIYSYIFYKPNERNEISVYLFRILVIATVLQNFASFGNVFERWADYYFVYICLYFPRIFATSYAAVTNEKVKNEGAVVNNLVGTSNECQYFRNIQDIKMNEALSTTNHENIYYNESSLFTFSIFLILLTFAAYFFVYYRTVPGMIPYRSWL